MGGVHAGQVNVFSPKSFGEKGLEQVAMLFAHGAVAEGAWAKGLHQGTY